MSVVERSLFVRNITKNKSREQVQKVLGKWSQMSVHRLRDQSLPLSTRRRLADCQRISEDAISLIKSCANCSQFYIYVCFDEEKVAQGVACVWNSKSGKKIYLSKIVTCPWNILAVNPYQREHAVRGSGTALLTKIQSNAIAAKKDLSLNSLASAKGFYLKMGFQPESEVEEEQDSIPMIMHCSQKN